MDRTIPERTKVIVQCILERTAQRTLGTIDIGTSSFGARSQGGFRKPFFRKISFYIYSVGVPKAPNQVWSMDFMSDQLESGSRSARSMRWFHSAVSFAEEPWLNDLKTGSDAEEWAYPHYKRAEKLYEANENLKAKETAEYAVGRSNQLPAAEKVYSSSRRK